MTAYPLPEKSMAASCHTTATRTNCHSIIKKRQPHHQQDLRSILQLICELTSQWFVVYIIMNNIQSSEQIFFLNHSIFPSWKTNHKRTQAELISGETETKVDRNFKYLRYWKFTQLSIYTILCTTSYRPC